MDGERPAKVIAKRDAQHVLEGLPETVPGGPA
jgi:hypothetical protein